MTYPSGRVVNYSYDVADRVYMATDTKGATTTTVFDSSFYLPFGPDTSMKLGNGIKVRKVFDKRYYADSIKSMTSNIFGRAYKYDHNGNITSLVDLIDNTKSYDTLSYDGVDRLLAAKGNNRADSLRFTYAKNENRLTKKKTTSTTTYNYTNNRLRNTTGTEVVNYGYNSNGSVTGDTLSGSTITYAYDKLNRIVKITGLASPDSFAYDGENKRVYRDDQTVARNFIYDIFGNLIEESDFGIWAIDYIWANGEPRARVENGVSGGFAPLVAGAETYFWYHDDHLGTPYVLTDKNKAVNWKISLDPFGETVSETNAGTEDNLRFPGQYLDRGSNLNCNWNRYYQPKIGRYYEVDALLGFGLMNRWSNSATWLKVRRNLYSYVGNNPTNFTDPEGLTCKSKKQECIENFLKNNYGNFIGGTIVPDFSLISVLTNFWTYAKSSALTLTAKGAALITPRGLSWLYTTTGKNLAAYPGRATAAADALERGLFYRTTAGTIGRAFTYAAVGVAVFSTTADAYARWSCRNVK